MKPNPLRLARKMCESEVRKIQVKRFKEFEGKHLHVSNPTARQPWIGGGARASGPDNRFSQFFLQQSRFFKVTL